MPDIHEAIAAMNKSKRDLERSIESLCPAGRKHHPVQHRDALPPWCPDCRRTAMGTDIDRIEPS